MDFFQIFRTKLVLKKSYYFFVLFNWVDDFFDLFKTCSTQIMLMHNKKHFQISNLFCWILMTFFYSDENFGFNWNHFTTSILRAQKTFSSRTLRSCPNSKQKPFIRPKPKEKFGPNMFRGGGRFLQKLRFSL